MPLQISFRAAVAQDYEYCKLLYFAGMQEIIQRLNLDRAAQASSFEQQWNFEQVRIITLDEIDVGWLQTSAENDEFFIAQLFVDGPFQRRGIGTEVVRRLIAEAEQASYAVRLNVVKINPALRLYERLGFSVTHEDDRKFYLKRKLDRPVAQKPNGDA
jgi:ribosomal protein S18 acetylase RimI-like enzyme